MTMIADDYAAIRSHMFGDDSFLPKKKAEPAPKAGSTVLFVADLPPSVKNLRQHSRHC